MEISAGLVSRAMPEGDWTQQTVRTQINLTEWRRNDDGTETWRIVWIGPYSFRRSNPVEQSPCWEANRSSVKKCPAFYGTRSARHMSLSWVRSIPSHFFEIHFNIILLFARRSSECSLSVRSPYQNNACTSPGPHTCHMPYPSGAYQEAVCCESFSIGDEGKLWTLIWTVSFRGVLPTVVRRCVWSRNLASEEAKAR